MNAARLPIVVAALLAASLMPCPRASACSVPVFRYALNYWPADVYQLRAAGARLSDDLAINLEHKPSGSSGTVARLSLGDREVWSGELTPDALAKLLDSPVRREVRSRILGGDSVVWVLVESGDADKDAAADAALSKRLRYLESITVAPELRPDDPFNRLGPGPALTVRYSIVRLSRKDPRELFTLAMLERDPADPATPVAYPVFGRGRVLIALPQEKLTADNIDEVCHYLAAACSCEIKDRRLGWDLMMQCDWEEELAKAEQHRLREVADRPVPATRPAATQPAAVLVPIAPGTRPVSQATLAPGVASVHAQPPVAAPLRAASWHSLGIAIGALVVAAGIGGLLVLRRRA
jgi:hypothetical protein